MADHDLRLTFAAGKNPSIRRYDCNVWVPRCVFHIPSDVDMRDFASEGRGEAGSDRRPHECGQRAYKGTYLQRVTESFARW